MREIFHEPEPPKDWVEHCNDEVTRDVARDIVRFMTEEEHELSGLTLEDGSDLPTEWRGAIGPVEQSLVRLVGAREDPKSLSVTVEWIGGFTLACGIYHGAQVAVLLYWSTRWLRTYDCVSVITLARDLFVYVHPDHNAQLVASVRGE